MAEEIKKIDEATMKKFIVAKCIKDPAFKKRLLADAKEAIEKEFHIQLPAKINIKALEETDTLYIVLPSQNAIVSGQTEEYELSDEELKAISGGNKFEDATLLKVQEGLGRVSLAIGQAVYDAAEWLSKNIK